MNISKDNEIFDKNKSILLNNLGENEIIDVDKISRESDEIENAGIRKLKGHWATLAIIVGVVSSIFHFWTAALYPLPVMQMRPLHLVFMLFLTFIFYPSSSKNRNKNPGFIDIALLIIAMACLSYLLYNYRFFALRGAWFVDQDIYVGFVFILVLIEASRRTMGGVMLILAITFLTYLFAGPYMPGILAHGGFSLRRVVTFMFLSTNGIFGMATGASATYVYLFILFGAFLQKSGTSKLFTNLALAWAGHTPGGPAKVAVIASALMGTINGSSAANVAATGVLTIPLMKSLGFKGYFAAAVEAVASTGGQFLPPVMGASAFIMADYLGLPYIKIAIGAIFPAILYYIAVFCQVHLRAKKMGLVGIPKNRLPNLKNVIIQLGHLFLPVIILVTLLLLRYTALFAASVSIVSVVLCSAIRKETRMSIRDIIESLYLGAKNTVSLAICCAIIGFVIGSIGLSGLGMLLTHSIIKLAGGLLLPTLLIAALCALVLSFGLPTTSTYIITATLVAPALISLDIPPLVAHLFCYYWGGVSAITPPVALAAYVGAGIAKANVMKTGFTAMRLGISAYILPFYFIYHPQLITREGETNLFGTIFAFIGGLFVVYCVSILGEQYFYRRLPLFKALILFAAVILFIDPTVVTQIVGFILAIFVIFSEIYIDRTKKDIPTPIS